MPNGQSLGMILFAILGFCGFLALGAFLGKKITLAKVVTYAGVIAIIAVVCFSVYAANYFMAVAH